MLLLYPLLQVITTKKNLFIYYQGGPLAQLASKLSCCFLMHDYLCHLPFFTYVFSSLDPTAAFSRVWSSYHSMTTTTTICVSIIISVHGWSSTVSGLALDKGIWITLEAVNTDAALKCEGVHENMLPVSVQSTERW